MDNKLSEKWARINIATIAIFYIISGIWEYLLGLTQLESTPRGAYYLLDIYRNYLAILGKVSILVGIATLVGMLFRIKFVRLLTISLAWWNLFSAPFVEIWRHIYTILIKKMLIVSSWSGLLIYSFMIIAAYTFVRIYVIYVLQISKAGYIFSNEQKLNNRFR